MTTYGRKIHLPLPGGSSLVVLIAKPFRQHMLQGVNLAIAAVCDWALNSHPQAKPFAAGTSPVLGTWTGGGWNLPPTNLAHTIFGVRPCRKTLPVVYRRNAVYIHSGIGLVVGYVAAWKPLHDSRANVIP